MADDGDRRVLATFRAMAALQARVCYMNVDRTLATWTRTALSMMVFGTIVDRYGLLLMGTHHAHVGTLLAPNPVSSAGGIALVAIGVAMAAAAALRHQRYRAAWIREHGHDETFGPWLAHPFSVAALTLGLALLAILLACAA